MYARESRLPLLLVLQVRDHLIPRKEDGIAIGVIEGEGGLLRSVSA
jgi:hypothetical protein